MHHIFPDLTLAVLAFLVQFAVAGEIIKSGGFGSLYKGLSAGLLRQATYTTARMGIFNNISVALKEHNQGGVSHAIVACSVVCELLISCHIIPMALSSGGL